MEMYQRMGGGKKGDAWCSWYVSWCLRMAGFKTPNYGRARSWFADKNRIAYNHGRMSKAYGLPRTGDLVGYDWNKATVSHVGFIDLWPASGPSCQTVEGNTSGGLLNRDGQGVFKNWRLKKQVAYVAVWVE
ncbi:CHAP domain-containing protein [Hymenobacter sp. BT491]|nr:CHAP domain-containing protein [Hymenobacter sp. BT491]